MRKSLLTLGLASLALTGFASTRILYQQNYETATSVAETGWSFGGASLSLASDEFGKYVELALGQNNGRSGQVSWGQDIYLVDGEPVLEDGTYTLKFDFNIVKGPNNQYSTALSVFTNSAPKANTGYRQGGKIQNYLFDMTEANNGPTEFAVNGPTVETVNEDQSITYSIDTANAKVFDANMWYTVTLDVNTNNRTSDYTIESIATGDIFDSGSLTVPENDPDGNPISMYAEGLFMLLSRYQTTVDFDNILISFETSYEWANEPTIALTGMGVTEDGASDPRARTYTITFLEEETLHVVSTDGQLIDVEYAECDGAYKYTTLTSGVLKAYTTVGSATSTVAEMEVECVPYVLPGADVAISSVKEGFGKTYTLTVNNADVPMRPTIFINYEFVGKDGEKISAEGEASGCTVTVTQEGTLKVTTEAWGYESNTISVDNDTQFETKKVWDFARMTEGEIKAVGFPDWTIQNTATTSGFSNWTGRKYLYYNIAGTETVDEEGVTTWEKYLPFGFVAEDSETQVLRYAVIDRSAIAETSKGEYFEGLTIFPERGKVDEGGLPNVGMIYHIGLYNDQTKNNNNNVYVNDLAQTDFVVVNWINNYGSNSCHPVCSTVEEYYAQLEGADTVYSVAEKGVLNEETGLYDVAHSLYRIDTAITKITVFKPIGVEDAVETINAVNGDGYYYSIDGIRVAEPTRPGLYIHNGKKIIVK